VCVFVPLCICLYVFACVCSYERVYVRVCGVYLCVRVSVCICLCVLDERVCVYVYGVATISRLLKIIGLFCRILSLL